MERAPLTVTIRAPKKGADGRTQEFVGATDNLARDGDIIRQNWDLRAFRRNGPFLWVHQYSALPLGQFIRVYKEKVRTTQGEATALVASVAYVPADLYPFAEQVRQFYAGKWMRAVSVGWRTLEAHFPDESEQERFGMSKYGLIHDRNELLEISAAPVGVDADALSRAVINGERLSEADVQRIMDAQREYITRGADMNGVRQWLDEHGRAADIPDEITDDDPVEPAGRTTIALKLSDDLAERLERLEQMLDAFAAARGEDDPPDDGETEGTPPEPTEDGGEEPTEGEEDDPESDDGSDEDPDDEEVDESAILAALSETESAFTE